MKKFLLTLGVACMALPSFASTRILYQQNFESCNTVEETGWTVGGGTISLGSNDFGKFLELALGQNNGRSGQVTWGEDIFFDDKGLILEEDGLYHMEFIFKVVTGSTNQYNGCLTVFTNHAPVANQPYRNPWSPAGYWQNYLFDMSQVDKESYQYVVNGGTVEGTAEDGSKTYAIDYSDPTTFGQDVWYMARLDVDTKNREVAYQVFEAANMNDAVKEGTLNVPETDVNGEPISMFAQGIFVMMARYQTTYNFDDIVISTETSYDYANTPTVTLTRLGKTESEEINLNMRAYTIYFREGETLHVIGTDGQEITAEYYDSDEPGEFVYETETSGVLKAYTKVGDAKSAEVEVTVDCNPVVLPDVTATVTSVSEGYGKTYTLSVNNADVPMRPTIFINYEFTGVNGEKLSEEGVASGAKVTVSEEGVLKLTSAAFGYESKTVEVKNDIQFETKKAYDFARMSKEDIKAAGFPEFTVLNSGSTSGFNNWTARKRLYYTNGTTTETGEDGTETEVANNVYPFGYISDDNTTNVIEYSVIDRAAIPETTKGQYFEGLTIFPDRGKVDEGGLPNVGMMYRIGLYNDQTKNNNNNIIVHDLDATDFVVVNYINNYGGNSIHPECATDEEYFKVLAGEDAVYSVAQSGVLNEETGLYDLTHALYRIDTACTKITVFKQAGTGAVEGIEAEVEGDNWYYSIDGVRMAEPTRPGIYIHNGKKIVVK